MTPYATFIYLGILLCVLAPLLLLEWVGALRSKRIVILLASALILPVQYWSKGGNRELFHLHPIWLLVGYAVFQYAIAWIFLIISRRTKNSYLFYGAIVCSLTPLIWVKSSVFLGEGSANLIGFVGISYITFRALDVLIGIRDGLISKIPPVQFAAFLLFFPTISSGPIDRFKRFATDWSTRRTRPELLADLDRATIFLFRGLLYKFIIAALIDRYWMTGAAKESSLLGIASYMYAYTFYLFFDFGGYSAFAISISAVVGIHPLENFKWPFLSRNIKEFWDRWHISLSWWFRDHVYMRFVLLATKRKWFPSRYWASYIGFFITMGLMGLWHGLMLRYIVYGLYHASMLVSHDIFARWNKSHKLLTGRLGTAVAWFITFQVISFGLLIFSGRLF